MTKEEIISTHSLTKRLTVTFVQNTEKKLHFNSQPHEEADAADGEFVESLTHFNSQPHEEADDA